MKPLFVLLLLGVYPVFSQPTLTSDIYTNSVFHNPAFAGETTGTRLSFNSRQQWLNPDYNFSLIGSYALGIDSFLDKGHIGLGAYINHEAYNDALQKNEVGINYSYAVHLGSKITSTFGLNASYNHLGRANGSLTFIDQYNPDGSISPTSTDILAGNTVFRRQQAGFGAGALIQYWDDAGKTRFDQFGYRLSAAIKTVPFNYTSFNQPGHPPFYFNLETGFSKGFSNDEENLIGYGIFWQKYGAVNQLTNSFTFYHSTSFFSLKHRGTVFTRESFKDRGESMILSFGQIFGKNLKLSFALDIPTRTSRSQGQSRSFEISGWYMLKGKKVRESGTEIDLSRISSNKFQTDCERFRNAHRNRKMYYLWAG